MVCQNHFNKFVNSRVEFVTSYISCVFRLGTLTLEPLLGGSPAYETAVDPWSNTITMAIPSTYSLTLVRKNLSKLVAP